MRSSSCASSTRSGARTSWLRHAGHITSASTVGRIVSHLRQGGRLKEAPRGRVLARRGHLRRPYTVRKPPSSASRVPERLGTDRYPRRTDPAGAAPQAVHRRRRDLPLGRAGHPHPRVLPASSFLPHLSAHMPFPISAIQVDGSAEFHGAFEQQCRHAHPSSTARWRPRSAPIPRSSTKSTICPGPPARSGPTCSAGNSHTNTSGLTTR